jgi:hypothetical protein
MNCLCGASINPQWPACLVCKRPIESTEPAEEAAPLTPDLTCEDRRKEALPESAKARPGGFVGFDGSPPDGFSKSSEASSYVGESRSNDSVCEDSGDRFMGISGAAEDILPGDGAPRMGQVNQEIQPGDRGALGDGGDRPDLRNHGGRDLLTRTETRERHKEILARVKEGEPVYVYSHTLAEGGSTGYATSRPPSA